MKVIAKPNALLATTAKGKGHSEIVLAHVAARLATRLSPFFSSVVDLDFGIEASTAVIDFSKSSHLDAAAFTYHIGSSCAMVVAVDNFLTQSLLERQLGGGQSAMARQTGKQCRATAALAKKIAQGVSLAVADAWPGGNAAEIIAIEDGSQFARADDSVATITLALSMSGRSIGAICVAFAIEGLSRIGDTPKSPRIDDWDARLRHSVFTARLPLRAILARPELTAANVMRLAVGDVLPISKPVTVPLYAGDEIVARGAIVESAGRTTVHIKMMELLHND